MDIFNIKIDLPKEVENESDEMKEFYQTEMNDAERYAWLKGHYKLREVLSPDEQEAFMERREIMAMDGKLSDDEATFLALNEIVGARKYEPGSLSDNLVTILGACEIKNGSTIE